jgi:hypothetical protein
MIDLCAGMGAYRRAHERGDEQQDFSYVHFRSTLMNYAAPGDRSYERKRYQHTLALYLHALA